ncbi:DUF429 domain-containing protein, partial [Acinetobacter baumannii]|uniref:DUF429 domain-containing protein n=1 Tax=Acinetobacter baumannii TaxID=470 RepID=UPI003316EF01
MGITKTVIGVDGCPFGWVATCIQEQPPLAQVFLYRHIEELWEAHGDANMILIDMP